MPGPHGGAQFAPVSGPAESPACTRGPLPCAEPGRRGRSPLRHRKGGSDVLTADTSRECRVLTLKKDQTAKEEGPSCQEQKLLTSEKF